LSAAAAIADTSRAYALVSDTSARFAA